MAIKPKYTKLAADGSDLPADHPNTGPKKHLAVRVEHPMLAKPIIVSAYRCSRKSAAWAEAKKLAAKHKAYGWLWRLFIVEEAFFTADRTSPICCLDKNFFPDAEEYETTWTNDEYAPSPSGCAWCVGLGGGSARWGSQSLHGGVRAVCAGQS